MNSASRSFQYVVWASWAALAVAIAVVGVLALGAWRLSRGAGDRPAVADGAVMVPGVELGEAWRDELPTGQGAVFFGAGDNPGQRVSFDSLFRLAGTFGVGDEEAGGTEERRGIVEVIKGGRQEIVGVGDRLGDDILVVAVLTDRMVLRGHEGRGELRLGYRSDGTGRLTDGGGSGGGESDRADTAHGLHEGRFGKQVSTNMWVLTRGAVEQYYMELMEAPERLLAVFDSLKPLRDENERITGYTLGIEGEREFFQEVGMLEGDVVRRVNGIPMTNRRRAEYLIRMFSENKLNAFALDIERNGQAQRLVYSLR